jgi:spore coat polysaccharide biosynthesis protein SpsF (cytidylyltransferase family)
MNIAIFVTTRVGSGRLPRKALLQVNGETVTDILISRLKKTKIPIIMTVPDTSEDHQYMQPIVDRNAVGIFYGDETNIIKRHSDCAQKYGVEWIIEADGDDVLCSPEIVQSVYYHITQLKELVPIKTVGLPLGLNIIAYPVECLKGINFDSDTNWGVQIFKGRHKEIKFNYNEPYFLTMDYAEDFALIDDILTHCKRNLYVGGICSYLNKHPEIAGINYNRNEERFVRWKD